MHSAGSRIPARQCRESVRKRSPVLPGCRPQRRSSPEAARDPVQFCRGSNPSAPSLPELKRSHRRAAQSPGAPVPAGHFPVHFGADGEKHAQLLVRLAVLLHLGVRLCCSSFLSNLNALLSVVTDDTAPQGVVQIQRQHLFVFAIDGADDAGQAVANSGIAGSARAYLYRYQYVESSMRPVRSRRRDTEYHGDRSPCARRHTGQTGGSAR